MPIVTELRRPAACGTRAEPSDGEFVAAVIRVHERIRKELRALAHGEVRAPGSAEHDEDAVIRAYCASYGVAAPNGSSRSGPTESQTVP